MCGFVFISSNLRARNYLNSTFFFSKKHHGVSSGSEHRDRDGRELQTGSTPGRPHPMCFPLLVSWCEEWNCYKNHKSWMGKVFEWNSVGSWEQRKEMGKKPAGHCGESAGKICLFKTFSFFFLKCLVRKCITIPEAAKKNCLSKKGMSTSSGKKLVTLKPSGKENPFGELKSMRVCLFLRTCCMNWRSTWDLSARGCS